MADVQDGKHLAILTDILEDAKAQLSLKVAVCTILRAAAQADTVSMSAITQVSYSCNLSRPLLRPANIVPHTQLSRSLDIRTLAILAEQCLVPTGWCLGRLEQQPDGHDGRGLSHTPAHAACSPCQVVQRVQLHAMCRRAPYMGWWWC